ncbi:MAG: hypothetical protein K8S62_08470 [Candidatus Sabulitectum sp.]|nr:hypothetical protein [Candidatus Sabulitectum sp.]
MGFPFLAAGVSAALLNGRLSRGLPVTAVIVFLSWYLTGFQGAAVTAICTTVIAISARSGYSMLKTLYLCTGIALFTGGLLSLEFPGFMNIGEAELSPLREVYLSAGLASDTIDRVFSLITYYSPGIGAAHIVLGSILSVLFFKSLSVKNESMTIRGTASFKMHWGFAWVPIICLITLVLSRTAPVPDLLLRIAKNLLIFSSLPYGIEGFQVAVKWARGMPGMVFMLIMCAVFAPPFVLGGLILLGILDTWFDYRKKIDKRIERMKNEGSSDQNS